MLAQYASPILTFLVSLVTLAVTWGILKATVDHVKTEVNRLRDTSDATRGELSALREEVRVHYAELTSGREAGKMVASRTRKRSRR